MNLLLNRATEDEGYFFVECHECNERSTFTPFAIYRSNVTMAPDRCHWCGDAFTYDYDVRSVDDNRVEQLIADIERITGSIPTVEEHVAYPFGVWVGLATLVGLGSSKVGALEDALRTVRARRSA